MVVSDLRITSDAQYTTTFTPPTAPLSSSGAGFHIKGTDASVVDKSQNANLTLIGTTQGSSVAKFGSYGISIPTGASGIEIPQADVQFGLTDFSIETWVKFDAITNLSLIHI